MSGEFAIKFDHVDFSYNGEFEFKDINLAIKQGELISVVGPNGGGKTTFLKLIIGLLKPDHGRIKVLGQNPEKIRDKIGYLPQRVDYDPRFPVSVRDVVMMGRLGNDIRFRYSADDHNEVDQVLRQTGLTKNADAMFSEISGGQRQRAILARTLACRPEILLLDEPTAYLDFDMSEAIFEILHKLEHKLTIIIVSHDIDFVTKAVKSVICVNHNVVRHPTEQITSEALEKMFRGDLRIVRHDQIYKNGERT